MRAARRPVCPSSLGADTNENYRSLIPSTDVLGRYGHTTPTGTRRPSEEIRRDRPPCRPRAPAVRLGRGGQKQTADWAYRRRGSFHRKTKSKTTRLCLEEPGQALLAAVSAAGTYPISRLRLGETGQALVSYQTRPHATTHDGRSRPRSGSADRNVNYHLGHPAGQKHTHKHPWGRASIPPAPMYVPRPRTCQAPSTGSFARPRQKAARATGPWHPLAAGAG